MKQIKEGMRVKHKFIDEELIVVADEKGPAYTGNEFKDNEISLSHAQQELKNSLLEIIDESKEVKEGGEWWATNGNNDEYIDIEGEEGRICSVYVGHEAPPENKANAALLVQSKNMYYTLKELDNAAMLFADEHNTANALKIGQMLADLHNAHMKAKEILAKANPNY